MTSWRTEGWPLWAVPIIVGVVPAFATLLSAYVAMRSGTVPSCIVFIDGCTSVSATGRYTPASYLFRGLVLPYSGLLAAYWCLVGFWLRSLGSGNERYATAIIWIGATGCVLLAVYVALLGSEGTVYQLMRRFGIYLFFQLTIIAQVLTALAYRRSLPRARLTGNLQLVACVLFLILGLLNVFANSLFTNGDTVQNVTEWNAVLVMYLNICLVAAGWRLTDYRWRVSVRDSL